VRHQTETVSGLIERQLRLAAILSVKRSVTVGQLSNNSMAIDVYCWLAYRLHALKAPAPVSWAALHSQFGRTMPEVAKFKWYFKRTLALALAVYPEAEVDVTDRGLTLLPSKPPVSPRVVAMSSRRLKIQG